MDAVQKLLQAIASLLWPLIVLGFLWRFRPAVAAIVESAKSRKFTLKIAGQELTMEEANQLQQKLIADLQNKVTEIEKGLRPTDVTQPSGEPRGSGSEPAVRRRFLWVDDNPKNNVYFVEQMRDLGMRVDIAESTGHAMALFQPQLYDCVISDMGRQEGVNFNPTAGLDLLRGVRQQDKAVEFVFYTSGDAKRRYAALAFEEGANYFTYSPTELSGILHLSAATHS